MREAASPGRFSFGRGDGIGSAAAVVAEPAPTLRRLSGSPRKRPERTRAASGDGMPPSPQYLDAPGCCWSAGSRKRSMSSPPEIRFGEIAGEGLHRPRARGSATAARGLAGLNCTGLTTVSDTPVRIVIKRRQKKRELQRAVVRPAPSMRRARARTDRSRGRKSCRRRLHAEIGHAGGGSPPQIMQAPRGISSPPSTYYRGAAAPRPSARRATSRRCR